MQQIGDSIRMPVETIENKSCFIVANVGHDKLRTNLMTTGSDSDCAVVQSHCFHGNELPSFARKNVIMPTSEEAPETESIPEVIANQTDCQSQDEINDTMSLMIQKVKQLEAQLYEMELYKAKSENMMRRLLLANEKIFTLQSQRNPVCSNIGVSNADDVLKHHGNKISSELHQREKHDENLMIQLGIANMKALFLEKKLSRLESQGVEKEVSELQMKLAEAVDLLDKAKAENLAMEEGYKHFLEDALEASKDSDKEVLKLRAELDNLRGRKQEEVTMNNIDPDTELPLESDTMISVPQETQGSIENSGEEAEESRIGSEVAEINFQNNPSLRDDEVEYLKKELEESEMELDKFRTVLQITQESLEAAERDLSGLRSELARADTENVKTAKLLSTLTMVSGLIESSEIPKELSLLLEKLGFDSLPEANRFLESRDTRVACDLNHLTESFLELDAKLTKTQNELTDARHEVSQLTHCLTLTSELSANEYQTLAAEYKDMALAKEKLQGELDSMHALLLIKAEKIADLQGQLKSTENARKIIEESLEHRDAKISLLCDEIEHLSSRSTNFTHPIEPKVA